MVDHLQPAFELVALGGRRLGVGDCLLGAVAALLQKRRQRTLERAAGVDLDPRIGAPDVPIAGGVVEMPVAVDDGGDRPAALRGIVEVGFRMFGVAPSAPSQTTSPG